MTLTEFMEDGQIVGGAYELSKLLQYGCEHYGMEPTPENMAWVHDNVATSAPLDRAAALEYAAALIKGVAGELLEGDEVDREAAEAAIEAWEAE